MAMTLRLPEDLDAKLEALARARHTSKHAVVIEAANRFVSDEAKTELVLAADAEVALEYADALRRLEDA
ncbi:ribbon-helix-helix protein, CopG family [Microbacterium sp.]|uniref:ribbon-helix-helix protein, CopG family n=1 Tax=Microbacterium sp. TaxID=51671 RepID=UPI0039E2659C